MRFYLTNVVVALTASMVVSACSKLYGPCILNPDCCPGLGCTYHQVSMCGTGSLYNSRTQLQYLLTRSVLSYGQRQIVAY
ncbi:uncharacterized protein EDB93DRAFT_745822 [Suillus bovinus]|uniref:uncharacterized protein n=1 Tax=Suillus bovinus TaxID=48563 RepID=UPI001B87D3BA|nr:uncharacterized protein EDB93DRAFT_745822 [Suillus bovinus]KAG2158125.1 hypothetical protein EDB93DRAFT_745822 [Suillus bovinus]